MNEFINDQPDSVAERGQFNILLVDDEKPILTLMSRVLGESGFTCRLAGDGFQALEEVTNQAPDLIISDIRMPRKSGVEMAEEIRQNHAELPLIFVTGYTDYESVSRAIKLQPIGFLEKPFLPAQLIALVERVFEVKSHRIEQRQYNQLLQHAITEKTKELEFRTERLMAEKQMLQGIISSANFGLIAVDVSRSVHLMNEYAVNALELGTESQSIYLGASLNDLLEEHLQPTFSGLFTEVKNSRELREKVVHIDELGRYLNIISYPIVFKDQVTAIVFIIHDVTEKQTLQKRLLQSAKLASIGELAAGVAHEINNPLGFVTSNCNTLEDYLDSMRKYMREVEKFVGLVDGDEKPTREDIVALREDADVDYLLEDITTLLSETSDGLSRVSKIVMDLKSFARVDADSPQDGNVNSIIEDALNLVRNELKYTMEIQKDLGELPNIDCFPNQLAQVFTNLFINARHATGEKGKLRIVSALENNNIVVKVADNGEGIPEKVISRIFDPFFTTKAPGKGTGMGLSISYGIIQNHGGIINVESTPGVGTEFTITLPASGVPGKAAGEALTEGVS